MRKSENWVEELGFLEDQSESNPLVAAVTSKHLLTKCLAHAEDNMSFISSADGWVCSSYT